MASPDPGDPGERLLCDVRAESPVLIVRAHYSPVLHPACSWSSPRHRVTRKFATTFVRHEKEKSV